jgi:hypothetical protein
VLKSAFNLKRKIILCYEKSIRDFVGFDILPVEDILRQLGAGEIF